MRALNNLNSLRAFEAAARHLSYVAAGDELCVTPAAVRQLVRALEDSLGVNLFHSARSGSARLMPTDIARSAVEEVRTGMGHLVIAMDRLRTQASRRIHVSVPRPFAEKWLLPRLPNFYALYPDYDLFLDTGSSAADHAPLAIRHGQGTWPGWRASLLVDDAIVPVCHPGLGIGRWPPICLADLSGIPLIHEISVPPDGMAPSWRAWLRHVGVDDIDVERGLRINDAAAVITAALAGAGMALCRRALVADDLAAGRLMCPFPNPLPRAAGYYVVHRPESASLAAVAALRDWLLEEAQSSVSAAAHACRAAPS